LLKRARQLAGSAWWMPLAAGRRSAARVAPIETLLSARRDRNSPEILQRRVTSEAEVFTS
jgi:hypothetical protein